MTNKKTWSRETALLLMGVLCYAIYQNNVEMVGVITWPILSYSAVAFGLKRISPDATKLFGDKPS